MAIKEKFIKGIAVLTVSGKLMGGAETAEVHKQVKSLLNDDFTRIIIDLSKVKWLNSQGLGVLISCQTSVNYLNGTLKIAGATERVNSLFMLTKLITVFDTYETVDDAVQSF